MFETTVQKKYAAFIIAWLIIFVFCSILSGVAFSAEDLDTSSDKPKQTTPRTTTAATPATTAQPPETTAPEVPADPLTGLPSDPSNAQYTIFLDAGHGWYDNGCDILGRTDIYEKDVNLAITLKLQAALESMGYTIVMIRENDVDCVEPLERGVYDSIRRIRYANAQGADYYVSIHVDNFKEDPSVCGTRVYYRNKFEESGLLADQIATALGEQLHIDKPKLKDDQPYNVIEYSYMPSTLIEVGFATNENDVANMLNDEWQVQFAIGVALGIDAHIQSTEG